MAFDALPPQPPPTFPEAIDYAREVLHRSEAASRRDDVRYIADIAYGGDPAQVLDIYAPAQRTAAALPVLVFFHGGGWAIGYKEWMGFMAPAVTQMPAILVCVSYRLAPAHAYPAAVEDAAAAVAWVARNIAAHGGDPDRVFVGGHSAGGHLSALIALDRRWLAGHGMPASTVKGMLPISGSFDLSFDPADPGNASHIAIRQRFLQSWDDFAAVSPLSHVGVDAPPALIAAGDGDFAILIDDAHALAAALASHGVPARVELLPGASHFGASARCVDPGSSWLAAAAHLLRTGTIAVS